MDRGESVDLFAVWALVNAAGEAVGTDAAAVLAREQHAAAVPRCAAAAGWADLGLAV